jgi:pimeloyl-ACP methyl ester carboxylesterase
MCEVTHRFIETNGLRMHIAEQGSGPLVVLLHGFPECWYSWRHQLPALAEAGFHAVAPDQRGYGQTDRPDQVERYTQLDLIGDVIGLLDALGEEQAVVVGHDFGAPIAWETALLRPDRVRGVAGLSVPYTPRGPLSGLAAERALLGDGFYQQYFQAPGVADAELGRDPHRTIRSFLYGHSGDAPQPENSTSLFVVPPGRGFLDILPDPVTLPPWLTDADIDYYAAQFARTGFTGALNWYRTIDRTWELMAPWTGARVQPPALYVTGERDTVLNFPGTRSALPHLREFAPNLKDTILLAGCGHWVQQERADEVNAALLTFLWAL